MVIMCSGVKAVATSVGQAVSRAKELHSQTQALTTCMASMFSEPKIMNNNLGFQMLWMEVLRE